MRLIRIIPLPAKKGHRYQTNLILFLATVTTVIIAGYLFATDPALRYLSPNINVPFTIALYALSILAIFGLHEFGHKIAAWRHGIPSSLPYFIPGYPPSGGTFGALILQDSPPVNRDALFDLGISGPLVGLLVTIPVIILGLMYSLPVSPVQNATLTKMGVGNFGVPILFNILQSAFVNIPSNYTLYIHPVAFAGWLGLLVTFLNTLPIAQLDGGHVFRAVLNEKWHRYASYAGLLVLVLSGFIAFAVLILILFMRAKHPGALDDVSKLSLSRKIVLIIFPIIWVLAYPMMGLFF